MALLKSYSDFLEAGCDEAGRGCLAGPVVAAAVVLPAHFYNAELDDSKKLNHHKRTLLRQVIETEAVSYAVAMVDNCRIDEVNILQASFMAMHNALDLLKVQPELILVDGNRFKPYKNINHQCVVGGDAKYMSIAAASILAKTYRDEYMQEVAMQFPQYNWQKNKGYPTKDHKLAILKYGYSALHRKSFKVNIQTRLDF